MSEDTAGSPKRPARRADAQRNIDRIVDAAARLYREGPGVSMSDVAKAAGVGRVTLYAHFPSRQDLARAVVDKAIAGAVAEIEAVSLDHLPADEAVREMLRRQWHLLDSHHGLHANIAPDVDPGWFRERHDPVMSHVDGLILRGREEGVFRTDLPARWLLTVMYQLIHAAADEIAAGELAADGAVDVLTETVMAVLRPPQA